MIETSSEKTSASPPTEPAWSEANVVLELAEEGYLLDDGRLATPALSCLVKPCAGDRVVIAGSREGGNYIIHLLQRTRGTAACVGVPGMKQLTVMQPRIELSADETLALNALGDVEVTAVTGVLRLTARNLFTTVAESLVENVQHYIGRAEQYLLDATKVLRMHGKQASVTAEHEVKIDAERISLG